MWNRRYDIVVVGGGLVGLATARAVLATFPSVRLCVLEKDDSVGNQQSGHNSGVIHSGVYYKPDSLKARLCVDGCRRLLEFCVAHRIVVHRCGKLIVAVEPSEVPRLEELYRRGVANGLEGLMLVDRTGIKGIEPFAAGVAGLQVPTAAIVDYKHVARAMVEEIRGGGAEVLTSIRVEGFSRASGLIRIATSRGAVFASHFINCCGLHSDRIAAMAGEKPPVRIVPFRGEYYVLQPNRRNLVRGLLYPAPDPDLPFLGVHFTRRVDGEVEAGPNAVLAFAREGYRPLDVDPGLVVALALYPGLWRMVPGYWRTGLSEYRRSLSKSAFVESLQRLVPSITQDDIVRGGAGVRAQALDLQGRLLDDFCFGASEEAIHVYNAPSPAATACLSIGDHISDLAAGCFGLMPKHH